MKSLNTKAVNIEGSIRLDVYRLKLLQPMTRSQLKNGVKELYVNGKAAKLSKNIKTGDNISIIWENTVPEQVLPENIPLNILYEDENVIAVNKASGMVSHPANGNWTGTLVNSLLFYRLFRSSIKDEIAKAFEKIGGDSNVFLRAGIVHRLDKDTSGTIITARNKKTERFLKAQFKKRKTVKFYIALLDGMMPTKKGKIKTSIFRSTGNRIKFSASLDLSKGKTAVSSYKVLRTYGHYSLAVFRIFTGRTHQIRVHAKFLGCPVMGDRLYGKKNIKTGTPLMLHSYILKVKTSADKPLLTIKAPLPNQFKRIIKELKECSK